MSMFRHQQSRLDDLAAIPLFHGLRDRDLHHVARLTTEITRPAGTVLCRQGFPGREAFVVVDGEATVTVDGTEVAALGPGAIIGEMALLGRSGRTATVTAATPMRLLVLSLGDFDDLVGSVPSVARRILDAVNGRARMAMAALATRA